MSAPTITASWGTARRTSTGSPKKVRCSPAFTAAHLGSRDRLNKGEAYELTRQDSTINSSDPRCGARRSDNVRCERSRTRSFRRSSRCGRRRARPTCSSCCLTTRALARPALSAGRAKRPTWSDSRGNGLKFTRFHTTALCSPTRQALLTGRNHHSVNMGGITETRDFGPRLQLDTAEEQGAARQDPQAQWLLDGAVRQVP